MMNHDYVTDAESAKYFSDKLDETKEENGRLYRLLERVRKRLGEQTAADEDPLLAEVEAALRDAP